VSAEGAKDLAGGIARLIRCQQNIERRKFHRLTGSTHRCVGTEFRQPIGGLL
jgi:hypothetical protein